MERSTTTLTQEEHDAVTQLLKSLGWRVVLEKLLLPELAQVSRHLENIAAPERETQVFRGAKMTLTRALETIYRWGRLPNPFEAHYDSLLAAIRHYTPEDSPPPLAPRESPPIVLPRRVARPVL